MIVGSPGEIQASIVGISGHGEWVEASFVRVSLREADSLIGYGW